MHKEEKLSDIIRKAMIAEGLIKEEETKPQKENENVDPSPTKDE